MLTSGAAESFLQLPVNIFSFRRIRVVLASLCLVSPLWAVILATVAGGLFVPNASAAPKAVLPGVDGRWRLIRSPHFELYSQNKDGESREVLHNLEILRAVFFENLKLRERLRVDVSVYYFHDKADFQAYLPEAFRNSTGLAGFHLFRGDRAVIVMGPTENDEDAQNTIFHEYVHHLFRITEQDPPLWFNEGTADVFAGMKVKRDKVFIGSPLEERALYLRQENLIPLDQLFASEQSNKKLYVDEIHTGVFYAESWALLHFLRFGDSGFSKDVVDRFLLVAGNGEKASATDLRAFFKTCFGCDYPEMQRRLSSYIRTGSYRAGAFPMPKVEGVSTYVTHPLTLDDITLRLAELSVRVNHSGAGELILLNAITSHPSDPRPLETLGGEALANQDVRTATERWEQALAIGSQNPAVIRELALMEGRRWFSEFNEYLQLPNDVADRLRKRLLRSIQVEPAQDGCYEMLAYVEAFADLPLAKNINTVIAHLPEMADKRKTLLALSRVLLRAGQPDSAAVMMAYLKTVRLDPNDAKTLVALERQMATDFPKTKVAAPSTESSDRAAKAPSPSSNSQLKIPSVPLPEDL